MNETEIFALSAKKPIAGSNYRKALVKAIGLTANEATKKKLAANLVMSWAKTGANAFEKGDAKTGGKIMKKVADLAAQYKVDAGEAAAILHQAAKKAPAEAKPAPQKVEIKEPTPAPAPAVSFPKPTEAELQKAKKSVALQMQYVPGEKPEIASGEPYKMAEKIIKAFNDKWAGKEGLTDQQLAEKVNHFKSMGPAMAQLKQQEKTHYAEIAAKAIEEKKKQAAAEAAKIAAEMAEHKDHYDTLKGIGFAGNVHTPPSQSASLVKQFWKGAEQTIKSHGLAITPQQGAYIKAYVGSAYGQVNKQLRNGTVTVEQWKYAAALDDALSKMPKYEGTVYRGADLTPEQFAKYQNAVGKVVPEPGFTSAGVKGKLWGHYTFEIKSKSAADIRSFNPGEGGGEVVFRNNTPFMVTKVSGNKIYMEEI